MSIAVTAWPLAARLPVHVVAAAAAWRSARQARRAQRRTEREIADLPPHLLRDIGLVALAQHRQTNGGRTLDHTATCLSGTLSSWRF